MVVNFEFNADLCLSRLTSDMDLASRVSTMVLVLVASMCRSAAWDLAEAGTDRIVEWGASKQQHRQLTSCPRGTAYDGVVCVPW